MIIGCILHAIPAFKTQPTTMRHNQKQIDDFTGILRQPIINDILIDEGLERGERLIREALQSMKKIHWWEPLPEFPPELERHRYWMDRLQVSQARDLAIYVSFARSLAFRQARKRVIADRKKRLK